MYQRIIELKKQLQKRKSSCLSQKQQVEAADIEAAYQEEVQNHNAQWQEKMALFKQSCKDAEDHLMKRQSAEYEATRTDLEDSLPVIPKHSPELLNLKRIQDTLVRNKEYKEAHFVQQQMIELEDKLKQSWGVDRDAKIVQSLAVLTKKQENEVASFKQKLLAGAEELKKLRAVEFESIVKKYQNLRKEIAISHKLERNRFEGKHTTGCGTFKTDLNQTSRAIFNMRTPASSRPGTAADNRSMLSVRSMKNLPSPGNA